LVARYQSNMENNGRQQSKWAIPLLIVFAIILLCVGIYQSAMIARLEMAGVRAPGEVIRLKEESSAGHLQGNNFEPRMSALGQKQTSKRFHPRSALPPKADIAGRPFDVR
jgi:hypothetical protein